MPKFLECTDLATGEAVNVNFDNVEVFEKANQSGRSGTKISFVGGRYIFVQQTTEQLTDSVNGTKS